MFPWLITQNLICLVLTVDAIYRKDYPFFLLILIQVYFFYCCYSMYKKFQREEKESKNVIYVLPPEPIIGWSV